MRTNETYVVNPRTPEPAPAGFRVQDIYYVLFRHKWKILLLSLLGFGAAGAAWYTMKPQYVSGAKVLVRFVRETRDVATSDGTTIRTPDSRGDTIMSSEVALLTSLNLAQQVVATIGATNIAKGLPEAEAITAAVGAVRRGISVETARRSSVLNLQFRHPDPDTARTVMAAIVNAYLRMHARVHTSSDILTDASRQVDLRRNSLNQIEGELRRLKNELGIVSLDTAKAALLEQMGKVSSEILGTEALLAESRAVLGSVTNALTASASSSNVVEKPPVPLAVIPPAQVSEYRATLAKIDTLTRRESELLLQFTPESPFVRAVRDLLREQEQQRQRLESEHPGIAASLVPASASASQMAGNRNLPGLQAADPNVAITAVRSLEAKLATLREQMVQLQTNAARLAANEAEITELERRKEIEEKQYTYHYNALEQARVDGALNQDKITGLSPIEDATPAAPDRERILKIVGGLAAGGLLLGLALAFGSELALDHSVRRPTQVESALKLPLYLAVPRLSLKRSRFPGLPAGANGKLLPKPSGKADGEPAKAGAVATVPSGPRGPIADYAEALRDRLMMYFQLNGLNHKPKLVGVTSCGRGSGVTTIASSLAASLSETGDGNVLYVDVNPDKGPSVHPFRRGKLLAGIRDALEQETRDAARIQDNLYMVSLADPASGKVGIIPKTLAGLVPKMKASDYDFIIFDLPPITQTSVTSKVAGLLDMTFVVLESEKTQSDLARKAIHLLSESRANVAAVLNKHKRYLPKSLDTDL